MCVVGSFRWQSELLGLLGGNMYCWVFYVVLCTVVGSFRWQRVLLYVLGGNECCCVF